MTLYPHKSFWYSVSQIVIIIVGLLLIWSFALPYRATVSYPQLWGGGVK
jgi:hypothetical protein